MLASGRPKLGIHPGLTDQTIGVKELALAAAERGIESFYLPEHTNVPLHYDRSTYPDGKDMPERYKRLLDPFIALAFVAAYTDMEIGTAVSLVANHDPVSLAKAIATLDYLSDGRFVLGVGAGWSAQEFETHRAVPGAERQAVLRETVEVLRAIWTNDVASYEGKYFDIPPIWSWPKPLQHPHPPILLGGPALPRTFARVAQWADGWLTMSLDILAPEFEQAVEELRQRWANAGRDPSSLLITALIPPMPHAALERVSDAAHKLGVQHLMIHLEDTSGDDLFRVLDDLADICANQPL